MLGVDGDGDIEDGAAAAVRVTLRRAARRVVVTTVVAEDLPPLTLTPTVKPRCRPFPPPDPLRALRVRHALDRPSTGLEYEILQLFFFPSGFFYDDDDGS